MSNPLLSIIIPVYNEAENISAFLHYINSNLSQKSNIEVLIIDGGSKDSTYKIVNDLIIENNLNTTNKTTFNILKSDKGRAKQMNFGAEKAQGSVLYFLHADSYPPVGFDQLILQNIEKNNLAGCFKMQFTNKHWWLQLMGWFTHFNWLSARGGDQSLFIKTILFKELKGFNESFIIYEDIEFIKKIYKKRNFTVIQEWLKTSARRYEENGIWTLQYHFLIIYIKRWLGASPQELYNYYKNNII